MEILIVAALLLAEWRRPDLYVRRWWARFMPRPALGFVHRVPAPIALAGFDLRRLAPRLLTVLVALVVWRALLSGRPAGAFNGVNQTIGFYWAMLGLLVLALSAAVGGRDREHEVLAALPVGPRVRIRGFALTLLLAAAVVYVLAVVRWQHNHGGSYDALLPGPWELAQPSLLVLGGGLFGLLIARLLPVWAAVPVAVVTAVMWTGAIPSSSDWVMLAPLIEWVAYVEGNEETTALVSGSLAWHNAYLAGLCVLGFVAAHLRESGPRRGLCVVGVAAAAGTVTAAVLAVG